MDKSMLPRHVAIIMDGNGRWARQRAELLRILGGELEPSGCRGL